ncbi:MAG TPA: ATP-binding protein [Pseudonocardia sp.]|nr:ATP-binding protein [Pseudonocardia sp.]
MIGHPGELLRLRITGEQDVFLARQRGREVAALAGLEKQDQVRVATALSELSRELAVLDRPATITLALTDTPVPALVIAADWAGRLPGAVGQERLAAVEGLAAARRLTDSCELTWRSNGGSVALTKRLPSGTEPATPARIADLRAACRRSRPGNALDVLRLQNQDLLETLESLQARQEDILRANAELEETNRGVMALHAELSEELEQTNRGVVALYAELDGMTTQLRDASESKDRFWASVSHELRTPLNSVLGLCRLLLDPGSDQLTTEQQHQIGLIRDSGAMLLTLVNELLDAAKAESGRLAAQSELVDLRALFDQLRASLRPLVGSPEVALVVEDPVTVGPLSTDPVLLGRILRNLVGNALKFTVTGEVRCLASVGPGGQVEIQVIDTGIGIPPEHQRRVFEDFYQVPGSLQTGAGGTGLGLPYARRLAGILGGALELASEPGRGTTMTLRLPASLPPGVPRYLFESALVVDDDPAFRALLHRALDPSVERVSDAGDGTGALRALRAERPDLVLLDLNIPPPDGSAVLTAMRQDPTLDNVPVVVVTSVQLDGAQRSALGATAALLDKAHFSADLLAAAVEVAARLVRSPR